MVLVVGRWSLSLRRPFCFMEISSLHGSRAPVIARMVAEPCVTPGIMSSKTSRAAHRRVPRKLVGNLGPPTQIQRAQSAQPGLRQGRRFSTDSAWSLGMAMYAELQPRLPCQTCPPSVMKTVASAASATGQPHRRQEATVPTVPTVALGRARAVAQVPTLPTVPTGAMPPAVASGSGTGTRTGTGIGTGTRTSTGAGTGGPLAVGRASLAHARRWRRQLHRMVDSHVHIWISGGVAGQQSTKPNAKMLRICGDLFARCQELLMFT